jgi:uncharacterized protein YcaQ
VRANDACRRDILDRLGASGPLPSRDLPDTRQVPWKSIGWTNNRNVIRLLDLMAQRGEVAVAGRRGSERLWDLAERVYPDDPVVPADEALRVRAIHRDVPFTEPMTEAVSREIEDLARWLGLDLILPRRAHAR